MQEQKNYYIVIPVTELNVSQVFTFIAAENQNLCNIGNNCNTLQIIPNPSNPFLPCYRFELSETWFLYYETQLVAMQAEIHESAEAYLLVYPPTETEII
jgi:hypothetical protein